MGSPQALLDMEITVHKGDKAEVYRCDPSDTLLSLKEKIDENEGIQPSHQNLFQLGYWLSEPSVLLGDFLQDGDELVLDLSRAATKDFMNNSLSLVWLVNGTKHKFKTHLLEKRAKIPIKLDKETFGIVYHTDGTVPGERKYQVYRYNVANFAKVELQTIDGKVQVVLFGNVLPPQDSSEYDEARSKTNMERVKECVTMAAPIGSFVQGITALVFGA